MGSMIGHRAAAFTIIEVMLFLAVSGVLVVAILAGSGAAIAAQRYKDAVATFQSDIQRQYEDSVAVYNGREGAADECDGGTRGASSCIILGKMMAINGGEMVEYIVRGTEPATPPDVSDEYALLRAYSPIAVEATADSAQMEWGTGITVGGAEGATTATVLVLRSPRSGLTHTFTRSAIPPLAGLSDMITATHTERQVVCVSPSGWTAAEAMAVVIGEKASTAGAVEVRTNGMLEGEGVQC